MIQIDTSEFAALWFLIGFLAGVILTAWVKNSEKRDEVTASKKNGANDEIPTKTLDAEVR